MKKKNQKATFGPGWLEDEIKRIEKSRGEYIKSRWYILEVTPGKKYAYGDGHGGTEWEWESDKFVRIGITFPTKADAKAFLDKHEPDEGNSLHIKEEKLYRKTVETWY